MHIPDHFVMIGRVFATLGGLVMHYRPTINIQRTLLPALLAALSSEVSHTTAQSEAMHWPLRRGLHSRLERNLRLVGERKRLGSCVTRMDLDDSHRRRPGGPVWGLRRRAWSSCLVRLCGPSPLQGSRSPDRPTNRESTRVYADWPSATGHMAGAAERLRLDRLAPSSIAGASTARRLESRRAVTPSSTCSRRKGRTRFRSWSRTAAERRSSRRQTLSWCGIS